MYSGQYLRPFTQTPKNSEWLRLMFLFGCMIGHPSVMLNKSLLGDLGYYSYVGDSADWYLWLKLLFEGDGKGGPVRFKHIYEPLVLYRRHGQGQLTDKPESFQYLYEILQEYFAQMYPEHADVVDGWLYYDLYLVILHDLKSDYDLHDPQRTLSYLEGMVEHYDKLLTSNYDSEIDLVRAKIVDLAYRLVAKYQDHPSSD